MPAQSDLDEAELELAEELELSLFPDPESVLGFALSADAVSDFEPAVDSEDDPEEPESLLDELARPFAEPEDERESVMYQPLPLNTMPTGWITLRNAPPHCSHVVSGGSEKLWRFSTTSSQAMHL